MEGQRCKPLRGSEGGRGSGRSLIISDSIPCFKWSYTDQFVYPLNYPSNCGYQFITSNISTMAPEEENYFASACNLYYFILSTVYSTITLMFHLIHSSTPIKWPPSGKWINRGKNDIKALIGTLITGHLQGFFN